MTWREDLRRVTLPDGRKLIGASFRGVPFFVEGVEVSGGRRVVVHEFPLRDDPFVEDLGRRARKFHVDGYVIGDDYLAQKNAMLTALETEGPGALVLPGYDTKRAIGETSSVRETRADGGMAVLSIEFCETPTQVPVPTDTADPAARVGASVARARAATRAELAEKYNVTGLPSFAIQSATTAIARSADALGVLLGPAVTSTQELASLTGQVAALQAQASSFARAPGGAIDGFLDAIVGLVETTASAPGAVAESLAAAYATDMGAIANGTTTTRDRERANQAALTAALRRTFSVETARIIPLVPYVSIEDATAARDQVAAMLEEQAGAAGDTAYPALVDLRSDVLRAVPGNTAFARIVTVTRNVPIPSLVLAYQLHGSVDQELDIVARNKIHHPGFVAGELKVLSDGG